MMKKITLRAILLVAVVLCGMTNSLKAQVTLMYPDATPSATFATIQLAYNAIDFTAHPGAHTIQIESSYLSSAETFPILLGLITGSSVSNAVTIKPATGAKVVLGPTNQTVIATVTGSTFAANAAATLDVDLTGIIANGSFSQISVGSYISGIGTYNSNTFKTVTAVDAATNKITAAIGTFTGSSLADNKLFVGPAQTCAIKFNGAKYVTIDGVSRTDASTGLTIQNPNSIFAQTIFYAGNSQYNTVKNCIIRGANHTGAWNNGYQGTIFFQAGTGNTCSYNTIDNNDVCDMNDPNIPFPICAFQMTAAGGTNTNQTISNNNIYNMSNQFAGNGTCTFMQFGSEGASIGNEVLNNRFYWTSSPTFQAGFTNFINIGTLGLGHRFEGNTIGYNSATATGSATLEMKGTAGTFYVLANAKNFTCKNNTIGGMVINSANASYSASFVGYQLVAHSTGSLPAVDDRCNGNKVMDITINCAKSSTFYGIMFGAAPIFDVDVKNCIIKNITVQSSTAAVVNTVLGVSANFNYSGTIAINSTNNEISNLTAGKSGSTAANVVTAFVSGGCNNIFEKNLIYNLNTISSGTGSLIKGIRITLSTTAGKVVKNNIIRLGTDVSSDAEISAIYHEALSSASHPFNIYHNTIYIGGTSQTKPSHCLSRAGTIAGVVTLKNNIFSNKRAGGAAVNQVYNLLAITDITTSEYNLYQYGSLFATVTTTSPATYATLSDWNSGRLLASPTSLSEDANSKDQLAPQFADATATIPDMHLSSSSPANESGLAIATVTDDFASAIRSLYTTASTTNADMGAYAISNATALEATKQLSGLSVFAIENNIMFNNLSGNTAKMYSLSGQLVKSIALTSDKVAVPTAKGLYIVKVDEKVIKVLVK